MKQKLEELGTELKTVFSGKNNTLDTILPPLIFAILQAVIGLNPAILITLAVALLIMIWRVTHKQSWGYALSGVLLVAISAMFALFSKSASSFFLPDLISSAALLLVAIGSNIIGKPLAAWSSHLTRAWPRNWYWHKQIRPAYTEVTWFWALFIALRLLMQWLLYQNASAVALAWGNALLGWPVTIAVLVLSYLYGMWRLQNLAGPSVDEFEKALPPPWQGQKRGF
ncbi:MAG: DUF3159 domain-containing protein [Anaerolineaceae bacterium]|nr:DUF3159 domain-containing protein [Anaerolineaceae bacterium]